MKMRLCLPFACMIALSAGAQSPQPPPGKAGPHTWTFVENGKIKMRSGTISYGRGGRLDADFIRLDGTNVLLHFPYGGAGSLPIASLSEADRAFVAGVA